MSSTVKHTLTDISKGDCSSPIAERTTELHIQMGASGVDNWRDEEQDSNPAKQIRRVQVYAEKYWKKNCWG